MSENTSASAKRRFFYYKTATGVILFVFVTAFCVYALRPPTYTAKTWIQVHLERPYFIQPSSLDDYDLFLRTQIAIFYNPVVLEKVLDSPDIANLPSVSRQRDKFGWLRDNLKIRREGQSELLSVSISLPWREDSDKIVNAVVTAYFEYFEAVESSLNEGMVRRLNMELNRQTAMARRLQDIIRANITTATEKDDKTGAVVDIDFQSDQLKRVNLIIDTLQHRIMTLQAEQGAPDRIRLIRKASVPTRPDRRWPFY